MFGRASSPADFTSSEIYRPQTTIVRPQYPGKVFLLGVGCGSLELGVSTRKK